MIYENDMPEDLLDSLLVGVRLQEAKDSVDHKFKPNGITDNRNEWERKEVLLNENEHNRFLIHYLNCEDYKEGHQIDWQKRPLVTR